jgi:Transglutaminase-like superfamily
VRIAIVDTPWLSQVPIALDPLCFDLRPDASCDAVVLGQSVPDLEAEELRDEFNLERVIAGETSDVGRVAAMSSWVHSRWQHDGDNNARSSSALDILRRAARGERFRCVEYGVVLARCLQAIGIGSRTLGLQTIDVETRVEGAGHVVIEAFLCAARRWLFVDPQFDMIVTQGAEPLSAVELQSALALNEPLEFRTSTSIEPARYASIIRPYLFYFDHNCRDRVAAGVNWNVTLVPLGATLPAAFQGTPHVNPRRITTRSVATYYPVLMNVQ